MSSSSNKHQTQLVGSMSSSIGLDLREWARYNDDGSDLYSRTYNEHDDDGIAWNGRDDDGEALDWAWP